LIGKNEKFYISSLEISLLCCFISLFSHVYFFYSIYTEGCVEVFEQWIARNLYKVAIFFIVFAVLEILPICFAQTVVQDIENIRANWRS